MTSSSCEGGSSPKPCRASLPRDTAALLGNLKKGFCAEVVLIFLFDQGVAQAPDLGVSKNSTATTQNFGDYPPDYPFFCPASWDYQVDYPFWDFLLFTDFYKEGSVAPSEYL